ncbi:EXOC1L isoform 2 [Pan troglodytes]|uniref:EXOC1L isoform 2 n=2 Tax=Hominidae TaxID=9604 RepID=A0A2J8SGM4_PONAB|nr:EXOC1L isoform 2 [Pan troglodytes]PNJ19932.1 EXOC1L isoform 2 [Pongo abelii]
MSSLVKEDLEKKLFKPLSQNLYEFIEIEFSVQDSDQKGRSKNNHGETLQNRFR